MLQTARSRIDRSIVAYSFLSFLLSLVLYILRELLFCELSEWIIKVLVLSSILIITIFLIYKAFFHKIHKGLTYMLLHQKIYSKLYKSLYNANYYIEKNVLGKKCAVIPKIKITVNNSLNGGVIYVENSVKFDKRLDELPISSGLPNHFVLIREYISDNQNQYIYEFEQFTLEKSVFHTNSEFQYFHQNCPEYNLTIDNRISITMFHMLIIGQTGSGKSYALYYFILQVISKKIPWNLFIIDPKYSGLYILGKKINATQSAYDIEKAILLLEQFNSSMEERKQQLSDLLEQKLDADYRTFNLTPICLIIDEYSAFRASLTRFDKKTRDKVDEIIGNIIREGRQLGCFVVIAQQQTNSQNLPTELKENIPCKIILGNSERQTYMTALGAIPDVTKRNFKTGEGIFCYPEIATVDAPLLISIPTLNFDILKTVEKIIANNLKG
ncbi:ftsK/SpoIIIE family protein [Lachnospiraceae bacterium CAG:364]|nr:ftsK/SpoIIIE family protein [Lachnospiraceae bacterium CAG:364]